MTDPDVFEAYGNGAWPLKTVYDLGDMADNGNYIEVTVLFNSVLPSTYCVFSTVSNWQQDRMDCAYVSSWTVVCKVRGLSSRTAHACVDQSEHPLDASDPFTPPQWIPHTSLPPPAKPEKVAVRHGVCGDPEQVRQLA